jgi:hypothetical protein
MDRYFPREWEASFLQDFGFGPIVTDLGVLRLSISTPWLPDSPSLHPVPPRSSRNGHVRLHECSRTSTLKSPRLLQPGFANLETLSIFIFLHRQLISSHIQHLPSPRLSSSLPWYPTARRQKRRSTSLVCFADLLAVPPRLAPVKEFIYRPSSHAGEQPRRQS